MKQVKSSLILLFLLSVLEIVLSLPNRIVGGKATDIFHHPYQVSIQYDIDSYMAHLCGGSILTEYFILTAAHCTFGREVALIRVRAGSSQVSGGGQFRNISNTIVHPKFVKDVYEYDIALIQLGQKLILDFSKGVAPVSLPPAGAEIEGNMKGVATGWGQLREEGSVPLQLQEAVLPTLNRSDCKKVYGDRVNTEQVFCAGYPDGQKDTCQGDSGGPFVYNDVQIGITSWGDGCGRKSSPGVYVKVSFFIQFIRDNIKRF